MPKRPRSHQIETQSRNAFRKAVPTAWVCRDLDQDYGVDLEVEVFGQATAATGEKFLVQLRATDEAKLNKALAVRLTQDVVRYYQSLDLPLLIVRYHGPSDRLYCRWLHTFDPYYSRGGTKYITFRIPETNVWTSDSPNLIRRELAAFRQIHRPDLRTPVVFSLRVNSTIDAAERVSLAVRIQKAFRDTGLLEAVLDDAHHDRAIHSVTLDDRVLHVKLAGDNGLALHTSSGGAAERADEIVSNVITAVGIAFDKFGHSVPAARLLSQAAGRSSLLEIEDAASLILRCFIRANQSHRAIELAIATIDRGGDSDLLQLLLGGALLQSGAMTASERRLSATALEQLGERVARTGDKRLAATLFYNAGRALSPNELPREVLRMYRRAARLYPDYAARAYFWRSWVACSS